jgi:hypothetical protein
MTMRQAGLTTALVLTLLASLTSLKAQQLPGIQDYYNRKGLFSDKGEKKKAFSVLQDYYEHMQQ